MNMIDITSFSDAAIKSQSFSHDTSIKHTVESIKQAVLKERDQAIIAYTKQFDAPAISDDTFSLVVSESEKKEAYSLVSKAFLEALTFAKSNIESFHKNQLPSSWEKTAPRGYTYGMQYAAIAIAGLYVPGGRALYPSSVLMNAIPAKLAGVDTLVMTTPPRKDGTLAPEILVAAQECGVDVIIKAGGAQAIFGLAYGTKSIPKVDKIVGPGNAYVDLAKQMVYGTVDIDKPAGPSEVLVYIEDKTYAPYAAAEMLAQCEHDPDASAIAISSSSIVLEAIQKELSRQLPLLKRQSILKASLANSSLFQLDTPQQAVSAINTIASEHLCLLIDNHKDIRSQVRYAGAIFCGPFTPVALGDYVAGPNHVLPTNRSARFSSALSVMDFMTFASHLTCSKSHLHTLSGPVKTLTAIENLDAHFHSVAERLT